MKTPHSEKWISDYFVGVFPPEELDKMIDESVARSLEVLEKYGDDVDWQIFFEMKVLKIMQDCGKLTREAHESANEDRYTQTVPAASAETGAAGQPDCGRSIAAGRCGYAAGPESRLGFAGERLLP